MGVFAIVNESCYSSNKSSEACNQYWKSRANKETENIYRGKGFVIQLTLATLSVTSLSAGISFRPVFA